MSRTRLTAVALALAVAAAACSPEGDRTEPSRDAPPDPAPAPTDGIADLDVAGRLLVLGDRYEITIIEPDGSDPVVLAPPAEGDVERGKPAWSPDGSTVAWTEGVFGQTTELVTVTGDGAEIGRALVPFPAEYVAFSPDGSAIALLGNDLEGDLRLIVHEVATRSSFDIDTGAPMYFDWHPTDRAVLVHVADRLDLVDLGDLSRTRVNADGEFRIGAFVGDNVIYGIDTAIGEVLVVGENVSARPRGIMRYAAPAAYVAHPDGDRIAILARGARESQAVVEFDDPVLATLAPARLEILDLDTGELETVVEDPAVAWFWSPDGERLLYSTTVVDEGDVKIQWSIYEDGGSTALGSFTPTGDFARGYLAFFDQYARTTTFWSPDSRAFTYAGGDATSAGIWVQVLGEEEPRLVSPGRTAVWSPTG